MFFFIFQIQPTQESASRRPTSQSDSDSDATIILEKELDISSRSQINDFSCWIPELRPFPLPPLELHAESDCTGISEFELPGSRPGTSPFDSDSDATIILKSELDISSRSQTDDFSCWIPGSRPFPLPPLELHAESDCTGISEFELPGSRPTLSYDFDSDATRLPESELDISSGSQFDDFSIPGMPFPLPPLELHAKSDCTGMSEFEPQYSRSTSLSDSDSDATRIPENSPRSQSDDFSCWIPETPPPPPVVQLHAEIDCTKILEIDSRSTSPSDSDSDAIGIPETELDNSPRSQSDDFSCWIPETPPPPPVVQLHAEIDCTKILEIDSRSTSPSDSDSDAIGIPETELDNSPRSQSDDFSCWIPETPPPPSVVQLHAEIDFTKILEIDSRSTSPSDSDSDAIGIPETELDNSPRSQSDDFSCWIPETPPPPPVVQLHAEIDCTKILEIDSRSTSPSDSDSDAIGIPETELDNSPRSQSDDFSCWIPETPPPPPVVQLHAEIDCTKILEIDSRSTSPSDSDSDTTRIPETELDNSPRSQSSDLSCWIPETDLSDIEDPNKEGRHSFFDLKVC